MQNIAAGVHSIEGEKPVLIISQVFSSVGVGLLIGILLGLSSAPVVGLVVGSVTAVLASLLGFNLPLKGSESPAPVPPEQQQFLIGIRAGCFGLSCIVGIMAGIYLRTHDVLSPPAPSLKQQFEELAAIGLSPQEARQFLVPNAGPMGSKAATTPSTRDTVLFSINSEACDKIAIDRFASLTAAAVFYDQVELSSLARIARDIDSQIPAEQDRQTAMRAVVEALCDPD